MGRITMTKSVKRDFFYNTGFFQCLAHYPIKTFAAVAAIGAPAVKKPDVRFFNSEICLKSFGHILRERYNTIFLVFALTCRRAPEDKVLAFGSKVVWGPHVDI